jgi:aminopeptidase N/puromycin-sensitive aminopeptidase
MVGRDPAVIADARELANRWTTDATSIDPTLADAALQVAVVNGDSQLFSKLQELYKTAADPQVRTKSLYLLADFQDPILVERSLEYATSREVRNQDAVRLFSTPLGNRDTRAVAWKFLHDHWDAVHAQLTMLSGNRIVGAAGNFCSTDAHHDVDAFFSTHKVTSSERTLQRANDAIDACTAFREAQQAKLSEWLGAQHSASAGR